LVDTPSSAAPVSGCASVRARAYTRAVAVALVVILVDQLSKHLITSSIAPGHVVAVMPGIKLVHWQNAGVAFSFLSSGGPVIYLLIAAALTALIVFLSARPELPWLWLPAGMLLGGAIGNLIDRVRLGAVVDFVKFPLWPAFNVADASITLGVIVLVIVIEADKHERR
jgi:signal peptidase II